MIADLSFRHASIPLHINNQQSSIGHLLSSLSARFVPRNLVLPQDSGFWQGSCVAKPVTQRSQPTSNPNLHSNA
jgi:hypothetical protein